MKKSGTLVISLDFELFWGLAGWNEEKILAYKPRIEGAVGALEQIIALFEKYNIKSTIGYVSGIQYRDEIDFMNAAPTLRPSYDNCLFSSYGLLLSLLKTGKIENELLFRPDVIKKLSENPLIELASHTYSHYYALESGQTISQFKVDIMTAKQENLKKEINTTSIIFPRNQIPYDYQETCVESGFTHFRGNEESFLYRSEKTPPKLNAKRFLRLLDTYINLTGHHTYKEAKRGVMIDVTASRFLRPYSPSLSFLEPLKLRRIKNDMLAAAKNGKIYHLWWHPHNFGLYTEQNILQLDIICNWFCKLKNKYGMKSSFMREL